MSDSELEAGPNNGVRRVVYENNHVAAKFPPYFDSPTIWFSQIEAIFQISNISSDRTKFLHLIANLPPNILLEFEDLLDSSKSAAYSNLKDAILKSRSKPASFHIQKLFGTQHHLGDRKPSQLLKELKSHMRHIQSDSSPNSDILLRNAFVNAFPADIRRHLVLNPNTPIDELAQMADRLSEAGGVSPIHHVEAHDSQGDLALILQDMKNQINALMKNRDEKSTAQKSSNLCFFHRTFGNKARKCQLPCAWNDCSTTGNATGSQ